MLPILQVIDCVRQKIFEKQLKKDISSAQKQISMVEFLSIFVHQHVTLFTETNDQEQKFKRRSCQRSSIGSVQLLRKPKASSELHYASFLQRNVQFDELIHAHASWINVIHGKFMAAIALFMIIDC